MIDQQWVGNKWIGNATLIRDCEAIEFSVDIGSFRFSDDGVLFAQGEIRAVNLCSGISFSIPWEATRTKNGIEKIMRGPDYWGLLLREKIKEPAFSFSLNLVFHEAIKGFISERLKEYQHDEVDIVERCEVVSV